MVTIGHQTYLHFNTVYIFMIYFTVWSMKWLWLNHVWEAYVSLLWNLNLALNHVGKQNIQCIICQHVPNWSSMTENRESSFFWAPILQGWQDTITIITRVNLYPNTDSSALWSTGIRYRDTGLEQNTQINPLFHWWVSRHCFVDLKKNENNFGLNRKLWIFAK